MFAKINLQCLYYFEHLSKSIKELSATYNERLEMDSVDKDETAQENEVNTTEKIPLSIHLNQELYHKLTGILYFIFDIFF